MTTNHHHTHHGGSTMNRSTIARASLAAGAAVMTGGLLVLVAPNADAHTPAIDAACAQAASYLHVGLTNYNTGGTNHVKVVIDGQGQADVDFGASYAFTRDDLTSDTVHTWRVKVTAWDDPDGSKGFSLNRSGSIEACGGGGTTTPTPTPTPTTPAPLPPADGSQAHDCRSVTVSASDVGAQVTVSIGDQDRTLTLVNGKGTLTFPPHSRALDVTVTITAPGRTPTVLHVTVPRCTTGPTPPGKPTPTPSPTASVPVPVPSPTASTPAPKPRPTVTTSVPKPSTVTPVKPRVIPAPRIPIENAAEQVTVIPQGAPDTGGGGTSGVENAGLLGIGGALFVGGSALILFGRKRATR